MNCDVIVQLNACQGLDRTIRQLSTVDTRLLDQTGQ